MSSAEGLLPAALAVAVPLHIEELRTWPWARVQAAVRESAGHLAAKGDNVLYRGARWGETAAAFNALARGIAACAFAPGGVRTAWGRWEARHPDLAPEAAQPTAGGDEP